MFRLLFSDIFWLLQYGVILTLYHIYYGMGDWLFLLSPRGFVGRVERPARVVNGCVGHLTYLPADLILVKVVENRVATQNVCIFGDGRKHLRTLQKQ